MNVACPVELLNEHKSVARLGWQAKRRNACLPSMT